MTNLNTPSYWDEVYSKERGQGGRRIDSQRLAFLVGEMSDWKQYNPYITRPSILDVGCGDGEMLRRVHAELPAWMKHGLDFCPATIDRNREETPCFDWVCGSVYDLMSKPKEGYAVIWCGETLEHLDHPAQAIECMTSVLRPGGYLCCSVPNENDNRSPEHMQTFNVWDCLKLTEKFGTTRMVAVKGEGSWRSVVWTMIKAKE